MRPRVERKRSEPAEFLIRKGMPTEQGNAHQDTDYPIITVPFELELKKLFYRTRQGYYFTDLGKIPVGGLSLSGFNKVQEPLILKELDSFARRVKRDRETAACADRAKNSVKVARGISQNRLKEKLADLKIYQLQLKRILRFTLYFLQIKADNKVLHKIGVTSRDMSDRLFSSSILFVAR